MSTTPQEMKQAVPFQTYRNNAILICESCAGYISGERQCDSCIGAPCECDHFHDAYDMASYITSQIGQYVKVIVLDRGTPHAPRA